MDEAGCEHIVEPFDAVQETATVDIATAPGQTHEHVHERINLVPFEGGMGGFVKFPAPAPAEYTMFFDSFITLEVFDERQTPIPPKFMPAPSQLCPDNIPVQYSYDLQNALYILKLGGMGYTQNFVGVVIEDTIRLKGH